MWAGIETQWPGANPLLKKRSVGSLRRPPAAVIPVLETFKYLAPLIYVHIQILSPKLNPHLCVLGFKWLLIIDHMLLSLSSYDI